MLWLGVHFPLLPLEVFTRSSPSASGEARPEVVVNAAGRVILRNAAAALAGIVSGSTLATAHSIAAGLKHYRRDPERERERLALLAEALYGFSARVSLIPPAAESTAAAGVPAGDDPSAGVVLEIGGSLKLFGDAVELARRARTLCRDMGHEARVRWASTPLAALVLARADTHRLDRVPLRQADVEPERLTAQRIERLANMGILTLGQLLALPRQGLARRFGNDLVDYLARLTGDRPDPRRCIQPPERFQTTLHLLEPLNSKEALAFPMQRLLTDLQHWLIARQLGTEQVRWHFTGSSGTTVSLTVRFARAQQSRSAFLDITRLQLANEALPDDVISLALEARRLTPWTAGSRDLFHRPGQPSPAEVPDELGELVDQLRARLGRGACYSLERRDQHTPEAAWSPTTPLPRPGRHDGPRGSARPPAAESRRAAEGRRAASRPLWLFDPPRAVHRGQLTLLRGPERIHTAWWTAPGQARDYYVARHESGAECWAYVDPSGHWFLHGYFA